MIHGYAPSKTGSGASHPLFMCVQMSTSPDKKTSNLTNGSKRFGEGKGREECHRQGKGDLPVVSRSCNSR